MHSIEPFVHLYERGRRAQTVRLNSGQLRHWRVVAFVPLFTVHHPSSSVRRSVANGVQRQANITLMLLTTLLAGL